MAVPDTTTFTLQDVVDTINPTTDDLVDCFADAISSKFDPTYEGSKDRLLNFRNYGNLPVAINGSVADKAPCNLSLNTPYFFVGAGAFPVAGDFIYTNAAGTTPHTGGNIKMVFSKYTFVNTTTGEIATVTLC